MKPSIQLHIYSIQMTGNDRIKC